MSARVITHAAVGITIAIAIAPRAHAAGQITVEHSRVTIAGTPFVVSGTLGIAPLAADFKAYTRTWRFGDLALRDVAIRVRARSNGLQACVAGDALGSRLVACGALPRSLEHAAVDVTWRLRGTGATGQGTALMAWRRGAIRVEHASFELAPDANVANGTLAGELAGTLAPLDLRITTRVRGAQLGKMLVLASDGKLEGSGLIDGELALRVDGRGVTVGRGALQARAAGAFRVRDAAWANRLTASIHGVEVHRRIENALSDFAYDRLALVVRAPGSDPDATLVLHGRGKRVAQELAITVNLRGVRTTARTLLARYPSLGVP